ncbi:MULTISPECIES: PIN/TRAM domain-containing protein [unclassified Paenibacillus]|uniref:PIN/TRAM domain-containing protein n=1 Tax=unclassified Paenibacillus TaxID=185978 RepID=UPI001C102D33|nr:MULTISPECIES: PIN/TRAM domain-containing protein [unclassified Paenibacillus]MBU5443730.1 PIN/TRAM domain-containing protein [Paenibacillus sp. MSJ-34]CAH0120767.1 putative PIN and TRAM-domain containing protein YacL [Paenibacillus sp. CECT 9249]
MLKKGFQILGMLFGAWFGHQVYTAAEEPSSLLSPWLGKLSSSAGVFGFMGMGAVLFLVLFALSAGAIVSSVQKGISRISEVPFEELTAGMAGLLCGLTVAAFIDAVLVRLGDVGVVMSMFLTLFCGYMGLWVGVHKREEFASFLARSRRAAEPAPDKAWLEEHKILDTSVIIDGRIADICKTGFIEGTIVIPEFVLEELQHIADSSDLLKRNRGRRGLDILNKIQKELEVKVLIYEGDFEEISEVDSKLVKLAKVLQGKVVTNDYNLNKVCELQGVSVLNINDLANAVKPVVLPGEEIIVQVIKDGKEHGQGVAYLDDGTMIVVEGGRDYIGTTMEVLVTSVLQTSAGRMIFAKPKLLEKAQ